MRRLAAWRRPAEYLAPRYAEPATICASTSS
jgi:hypothetical protein